MNNTQNGDMVHQILALSMSEPGAIEYFFNNLSPAIVNDFGKGHGELYRALLTFYEKTGVSTIDRIGFTRWIKNETRIIEALGGEETLNEYIDFVEDVETSDARTTTALLIHESNRTKQEAKVEELAEVVKERPDDYIDRVSTLTREIQDYNASGIDPLKGVYDGSTIAMSADRLWELPEFMATPFPSLNKAIGYDERSGFLRQSVHAILAQSGHGKSTFAKMLFNHWVQEGYTCLFVNYEEAKDHWERVLFTQLTKQNVYLSRKFSAEDKKKYTQMFKRTLNEWDGRFMVKHDPDTPYYEDMESWVRTIVSRGKKIDVLFIDTIQSMFLKNGRNLPRWGQYEQMMVRLEKLAKDLDCAVVITAQENSNRLKEKREVVQQSDIGGSLAIAQKSSVAIFLTKAKMHMGDDSMSENVMQLQIPKNRITGVTSSKNPPLVKYNDATKSYEQFTVPDSDNYENDGSAIYVEEDIFEPY